MNYKGHIYSGSFGADSGAVKNQALRQKKSLFVAGKIKFCREKKLEQKKSSFVTEKKNRFCRR